MQNQFESLQTAGDPKGDTARHTVDELRKILRQKHRSDSKGIQQTVQQCRRNTRVGGNERHH